MLSRLRSVARKIVRPDLHKPEIKLPFRVYGSDYGSWPVLHNLLDDKSIVYSFGVGRDITFDLAIIEAYGCAVEAFDPTPRSIAWFGEQTVTPKFHFNRFGIAAQDGEVFFFEPGEQKHVSYSEAPNQENVRAVPGSVRRLTTIMSELKHDRIDLLKMDIEGFEYAVIDDMLSGPVRPRQFVLEFHHRMYKKTDDDTRRTVSKLKAAGYRLFYLSKTGREYGFTV